MKKEYKIGLFFILMLAIALMAALIWRRQFIGDIADKNGAGQGNESREASPENGQRLYDDSDDNNNGNGTGEVSEVQKVEIVTTCDTVCIYEDIDKKDGTVTMNKQQLPAKYIGLKREELETALEEDSKAPSLEDRERGFRSQHLELFSAEQVKILRIYDTTQELTGYYIMETDGEICVYESDRTTLYFKTGLKSADLPAEVRSAVQKGKYMDNELQVYHFIESYSS